MKNLLQTIDLRKTYRVGKVGIEALRGVTLGIREGELAAIMGPSGCGKSTLMHILGGMTKPTSGRVFVRGQELTGLSDSALTKIRREQIGFVFQKFNLLPTLTARGNIQIAQHIRGNDSGKLRDDNYLTDILKLLMIEDKMDRKPSELSGGEQQRVAIARAVAKQPAILLADEPTGSLDSRNSEIVLNMFRELNRKFRQTIILVTHNPELVNFTDRLIEMRDGVIVGDNDPSWDTEREMAQPTRSV
jgi:putative ABC transport system ATP-binding protein